MQMISTFKTIHNFIDKYSKNENEDALCISENLAFHLFSMSDGAGGAGIYCKEWATMLASNQPQNPFDNEIDAKSWFLELSKTFYDLQRPKIDMSDPFIREKHFLYFQHLEMILNLKLFFLLMNR